MQFFRSCFRERGSPNGEDFYPQTRRFPAAILGGSQGEATQYTDKKTAQAVCNAYENGFSGRNEMKEKGWRPFWAALLAALLVLLPLVGGTVLLTRRSLRTRLASRPQSGVAIRQPKDCRTEAAGRLSASRKYRRPRQNIHVRTRKWQKIRWPDVPGWRILLFPATEISGNQEYFMVPSSQGQTEGREMP